MPHVRFCYWPSGPNSTGQGAPIFYIIFVHFHHVFAFLSVSPTIWMYLFPVEVFYKFKLHANIDWRLSSLVENVFLQYRALESHWEHMASRICWMGGRRCWRTPCGWRIAIIDWSWGRDELNAGRTCPASSTARYSQHQLSALACICTYLDLDLYLSCQDDRIFSASTQLRGGLPWHSLFRPISSEEGAQT